MWCQLHVLCISNLTRRDYDEDVSHSGSRHRYEDAATVFMLLQQPLCATVGWKKTKKTTQTKRTTPAGLENKKQEMCCMCDATK